nr:hypothetical protein [Priestia megaterium]
MAADVGISCPRHGPLDPPGQPAVVIGTGREWRPGNRRRWRAAPGPQPVGPRTGHGHGALGA